MYDNCNLQVNNNIKLSELLQYYYKIRAFFKILEFQSVEIYFLKSIIT